MEDDRIKGKEICSQLARPKGKTNFFNPHVRFSIDRWEERHGIQSPGLLIPSGEYTSGVITLHVDGSNIIVTGNYWEKKIIFTNGKFFTTTTAKNDLMEFGNGESLNLNFSTLEEVTEFKKDVREAARNNPAIALVVEALDAF